MARKARELLLYRRSRPSDNTAFTVRASKIAAALTAATCPPSASLPQSRRTCPTSRNSDSGGREFAIAALPGSLHNWSRLTAQGRRTERIRKEERGRRVRYFVRSARFKRTRPAVHRESVRTFKIGRDGSELTVHRTAANGGNVLYPSGIRKSFLRRST
jgi:hypothetical protein